MKILVTWFIVIFVVCVGGCGATAYEYYVLNRTQNKLMGHDESHDLDLAKTCDPDPGCYTPNPPPGANCAKCGVMMLPELFKAKKEILNLRESLKRCQKGNPPQ